MTQLILIIIGIAIGALLFRQKTRPLFRALLRTRLRKGTARLWRGKDKIAGICAAAVGRDAKKRENLAKILDLLASSFDPSTKSRVALKNLKGDSAHDKRGFSNSDIRKALGVSAASVTRYMDELEKQGKIEQIGDAGHAVVYRLK